ncbi:MAG: carbon storage regulator [Planctomycetes bacterium]|nr:carbon storage regulator [Planctomycetota bacterium]
MLVVSRKVGQRILIGDKITVTVVKVGGGGVRIGVEAPPEMAIIREELAEKLREAERLALEVSQPLPVESDPA